MPKHQERTKKGKKLQGLRERDRERENIEREEGRSRQRRDRENFMQVSEYYMH